MTFPPEEKSWTNPNCVFVQVTNRHSMWRNYLYEKKLCTEICVFAYLCIRLTKTQPKDPKKTFSESRYSRGMAGARFGLLYYSYVPSFCLRNTLGGSEVLGQMFVPRPLGSFFWTSTDDSKTRNQSFCRKEGPKSPIYPQLRCCFFCLWTMP